MALVVGIGLYTVYVGRVRPGQSDRASEETTIDLVWEDLEDGERGVFPVCESGMDGKMVEAIVTG
ncbi:DUF7285 family protein [Halosolutus halophilus]|uniref:DUF7285 family protein n=1 Tax=Halosolutus halophilus TaxID=1552990 RepID=UPI002234EE8E|nr:hypothetical protein [Halosolutus halophilus]